MKYTLSSLLLLVLQFSLISYGRNEEAMNRKDTSSRDKQTFVAAMQKHLDAVSNRDLPTLKSTMHPDGKMQLILPGAEIINGVNGFIDYHKEWFKTINWTFETNILNTEVGENFGLAIVEIIYRESERNGKPYYNRMVVSYALEKVNKNWCIIKDHACSIEKSTDKK